MAEYVAASQLKKIPLSERILERDVTFRPDLVETKPKPEIDLLSVILPRVAAVPLHYSRWADMMRA